MEGFLPKCLLSYIVQKVVDRCVTHLHCPSWDQRRLPLKETQKQDFTMSGFLGAHWYSELQFAEETANVQLKMQPDSNLRHSHMVNVERDPRSCIFKWVFQVISVQMLWDPWVSQWRSGVVMCCSFSKIQTPRGDMALGMCYINMLVLEFRSQWRFPTKMARVHLLTSAPRCPIYSLLPPGF